jgi:hypothetical protein
MLGCFKEEMQRNAIVIFYGDGCIKVPKPPIQIIFHLQYVFLWLKYTFERNSGVAFVMLPMGMNKLVFPLG